MFFVVLSGGCSFASEHGCPKTDMNAQAHYTLATEHLSVGKATKRLSFARFAPIYPTLIAAKALLTHYWLAVCIILIFLTISKSHAIFPSYPVLLPPFRAVNTARCPMAIPARPLRWFDLEPPYQYPLYLSKYFRWYLPQRE